MNNKINGILLSISILIQLTQCSNNIPFSLEQLAKSLNDLADTVQNTSYTHNEQTQHLINLFNQSSSDKKENILHYLNDPKDSALLSIADKQTIIDATGPAHPTTAQLLIDSMPSVEAIKALPQQLIPDITSYLNGTSNQLTKELLAILEEHNLDQKALDDIKNILSPSVKQEVITSLIQESDSTLSEDIPPAPPMNGPPPPSGGSVKANPALAQESILTQADKDTSDRIVNIAIRELYYYATDNLENLLLLQKNTLKAFLKERLSLYKKSIGLLDALFETLVQQLPMLLDQHSLEQWYVTVQNKQYNSLTNAYLKCFEVLFFDHQKIEESFIEDIVLHCISAWRIEHAPTRTILSTEQKEISDEQFFNIFEQNSEKIVHKLSVLRTNPLYSKFYELNKEFHKSYFETQKVSLEISSDDPFKAINNQLKEKNKSSNYTACTPLMKSVVDGTVVSLFNQNKCLADYVYYPKSLKAKELIAVMEHRSSMESVEKKETDQKEELYLSWHNSKNKLTYQDFIKKALSAVSASTTNSIAALFSIIVNPANIEQHDEDMYIELSSNKLLVTIFKSQRLIVKLPTTSVEHYQQNNEVIKKLFKKKYEKQVVVRALDITLTIIKQCLALIEQTTTPSFLINQNTKDILLKLIAIKDEIKTITAQFLDGAAQQNDYQKKGIVSQQKSTLFNKFIQNVADHRLYNQDTVIFLNDVYSPLHTCSSISLSIKKFISSWGIVLNDQQALDIQASITYNLQSKLYGMLVQTLEVFIKTIQENGPTSITELIENIQKTIITLKSVMNEDDKKRNDPIVLTLEKIINYLDICDSYSFNLTQFAQQLFKISFEETSLPHNQLAYQKNRVEFIKYINEIMPMIQYGSIIMLRNHLDQFTKNIQKNIYHIEKQSLPGLDISFQRSNQETDELEASYALIKKLIEQFYLPELSAIKAPAYELNAHSLTKIIEQIDSFAFAHKAVDESALLKQSEVMSLKQSQKDLIIFYYSSLHAIKNQSYRNAIINYINFLNKNISSIILNSKWYEELTT